MTVTSPRTPVVVPFDPRAVLAHRGSVAPFDPGSIVVAGSRGPIPAQISEGLETGNAGTVSWLVPDPGRQTFHLYFDVVRSPTRRRSDEPVREPIGAGDAFFHNRPNGFDRLGVGMMNDQPLPVDWDGDGTTDLLQRNLYSATYGEPWWGIYLWRNVGTDATPRFARYLRLRADDRWIEDKYASYQLVDWNRDGRLDLLCGVGSGEDRGHLKVYVNTGQRDARGLPILKLGPVVRVDGGGRLTYGMRLLDWNGRGLMDLFTLLLRVEYFPTQLVELTLYRHPNLAGPNDVPRFGAAEVVPLAGKNVQDVWPSAFLDINGDGKPDLIGSTRDSGAKPPRTCLVVWENTGANDRPEFTGSPTCIFDTSPQAYAVPTSAAPWRGLLVNYLGAWLRRVEPAAGGFLDRGLLEARGLPCAFGGYSSVDVVDWEGDGDLDFVGGNDVGNVQLIENVSTPERTMFRTARPIPLIGGGTMLAARWQFIDDLDPERTLGQSKPMVIDWDGDGDLDILVGNNSNRIAYFENQGTRRAPLYAPFRKLVHDGGEHFSFRSRPCAVDWNGDGLPDLVAGSSRGRDRNDGPDIAICLYLRYRAPGGERRLRAGEPFRLEAESGANAHPISPWLRSSRLGRRRRLRPVHQREESCRALPQHRQQCASGSAPRAGARLRGPAHGQPSRDQREGARLGPRRAARSGYGRRIGLGVLLQSQRAGGSDAAGRRDRSPGGTRARGALNAVLPNRKPTTKTQRLEETRRTLFLGVSPKDIDSAFP